MIRIHREFADCAKRWRLERAIDASGHKWRLRGVGAPMSGYECLQRLLEYLSTRDDPDGGLAHLEPEEIEGFAGWRGKPGVFYAAAVACGFVEESGPGQPLRYHDYGEVNGSYVRERLDARRRANESRERRRTARNGVRESCGDSAPHGAGTVRAACGDGARSVRAACGDGATPPNRTEPNRTEPGEPPYPPRKRRDADPLAGWSPPHGPANPSPKETQP